ncbi:MAG: hypothetical protein JXA38_02345 [Methanosarcinaceae archaeon]|nr:hypothetical protein [Methanosarcinaceae archaeon]
MTEVVEYHPGYQRDQEELAIVYARIADTVLVPPFDPEKDYVINVGCGDSPDQIAINMAFGKPGRTSHIPVVGIDLTLSGFRYGGSSAEDQVRPEDNVKLIMGDASQVIPKVVAQRGSPRVIVARNVDARFKKEEIQENKPDVPLDPILETSWQDVIKAIYNALPEKESGFFIATYKDRQELIPLIDYINRVGFICIPVDGDMGTGSWQQEYLVRSDQCAIVGVKNIQPDLVAKIQKIDPTFTPEGYAATLKRDLEYEQLSKIRKRYRHIQEELRSMPAQDAWEIIQTLAEQKGLEIPELQEKELSYLFKNGKRGAIFTLSQADEIPDHRDEKDVAPTPDTGYYKSFSGQRRRFWVEKDPINDDELPTLAISRATLNRHPHRGDFILDTEIPDQEMVRVFTDLDGLETIEQQIATRKTKTSEKQN